MYKKTFLCWSKVLVLATLLLFFYQCKNDDERQPTRSGEIFDVKLPYQDSLQLLFSTQQLRQIQQYRTAIRQIATATDAANFYQIATTLRDTLTLSLNDYTEQFTNEELPDLFWLKVVLPTFTPQIVAEGTTYYLFHDYRQWEPIVRRTSDPIDDEFVELQYQLYPEDSIEYFFPAYFLQTWDYGGSSLLGRGLHTDVLNTLERSWADSSRRLFRAEIMLEKERLLNDILASTEGGYWETSTNILNELGEIISTDFAVLSLNEKIALRQRQQQFQNPQKNNILVDVQSGTE